MSSNPSFVRRMSDKVKTRTSRSASLSTATTANGTLATTIENEVLKKLNEGDSIIKNTSRRRSSSVGTPLGEGSSSSSNATIVEDEAFMSGRKGGSSRVSSGELVVDTPDRLDLPEVPSSRWYLHARAITLRQLATLGFSLHNRSDPPAPRPTKIEYIDSKLSEWPGKDKIQLDIWTPTSPPSPSHDEGRPCVINVHGGGFVVGNGTDDSRWAAAVMDGIDAVVISVNHRLAPGYPFPTPVEDCADAILHVNENANRYGVDPDKLFLSGFSAGGNLVFSSHHLLQQPTRWKYPELKTPRIRGIIAFYPLLDYTTSRRDKRQKCPNPELTLPESLTGLFDQSYLYPAPHRSDPRLSPSKAPDDLLRTLPNIHLCCCEHDMLLAEAEDFRDRMRQVEGDRAVSWRLVKGEKHGFDKPPSMSLKECAVEEYKVAVEKIREWLGDA